MHDTMTRTANDLKPENPRYAPSYDDHRPYIDGVIDAIRSIGIPVREGPIAEGDFLPGILIEASGLVVDRARGACPGDLIHEAGHLAVLSAEERARTTGTLVADGGQETAALAWSYAFAQAHDIPDEIVFHDQFKAGGPWLRELFGSGQSFGVPLLQLWEMTRCPDVPEADTSEAVAENFGSLPEFPKMAKWLRD